MHQQGSAKRWALGCVNPASSLPLSAGGEFTQPRAYLLADPCIHARARSLSIGLSTEKEMDHPGFPIDGLFYPYAVVTEDGMGLRANCAPGVGIYASCWHRYALNW